MCVLVPTGPQSVRSGVDIIDTVSHMSRRWELTSGPLQEQQLLLTAEQTVKIIFYIKNKT